ncbi:preprotein translocase subunit SecE [Pseudanabaena sp. PCC 6802]|uniref:preprotein translocase subunit SecE n=1 Tax=Pseudanabaena sp. PCC 6802 TaxID=118173 RepID=UPI0003451EF5|nr:preprotein translocase subunit SecE [Pseudanabaena sp. PCC 6802]
MTKNEVKDLKDKADKSKEVSDTEQKASFADFFKDTKAELDKVVWPSRQQLISESAAVLLMVVAAATLIYLVDGLFGWVALQVFR